MSPGDDLGHWRVAPIAGSKSGAVDVIASEAGAVRIDKAAYCVRLEFEKIALVGVVPTDRAHRIIQNGLDQTTLPCKGL